MQFDLFYLDKQQKIFFIMKTSMEILEIKELLSISGFRWKVLG